MVEVWGKLDYSESNDMDSNTQLFSHYEKGNLLDMSR